MSKMESCFASRLALAVLCLLVASTSVSRAQAPEEPVPATGVEEKLAEDEDPSATGKDAGAKEGDAEDKAQDPVGPSGAAGDILIVESQMSGSEVRLYHEPVVLSEGQESSVQVAGKDCLIGEGAFSVPDRGGDPIDELIVIDRGGTPTTGMGPHGTAILRGVQLRVLAAMAEGRLSKVAILDSHGVNSQPRRLPLTSEEAAIKAFLDPDTAPPSNGAGADPYGSTLGAMEMLDASDAPLKVVTLISDGIDPGEESGQGSQRQQLVSGAARRKLSVHGLHIDRSQSRGLKSRAKTRLQRGRGKLNGVAGETGGSFRSVLAGKELASEVKAQLDGLMRPIAGAARTVCSLCGSNENPQTVPVELRLTRTDDASVVRRSRAGSRGGEIELAAADFERCEGDEPSEENRLQQWLTMGGGGFAVVLIVGLLLMRSRKQQARDIQQAQADSAARLEEERQARLSGEQAHEQANLEAADERVRLQAELERQRAEESARAAHQQEELERLHDAANPDLWVLSADGVQGNFPLKAGNYLVGAGEDCQIVLNSSKVSGHHALLEVTRERVMLTDQGSTNGTFLNGQQLQGGMAVETAENDIIAFSKTVTVKLERAK